MKTTVWLRAADRAYAALVKLFPREFRLEFEEELRHAFRAALADRFRTGGAQGAAVFVQREFTQAVRLAVRERRGARDLNTPTRRIEMPGRLLQDVRLTIRGLRRAPGFAGIAATTLAIGLAVNIVLFSLINAVRHPELPFRSPTTLLAITESFPRFHWTQNPTSLATLADLRSNAGAFSDVAAYSQRRVSFADGQVPVRLGAAVVSANLWTTLGVAPRLGRSFSESDDRAGALPTVMLGDRLWRQRFGASEAVIGTLVIVDGVQRTVIGVMGEGLQYPEAEDLWLPLSALFEMNPRAMEQREARGWGVVARLRNGMTISQARAELATLAARNAEAFPLSNAGWTLDAVTLADESFAATGAFFGALQLGGLLLVSIMCTNLGNMLLARGERRRREMAIRASMGASRARLMWLLILEPILLALIGGTVALVIAAWALQLVPLLIRERIPFFIRFRIDTAVVVFAIAITAITGLIAGIASAVRTTGGDPFPILTRSSQTVVGAPNAGRLRSIFLFVQTAVAGALMTSTLVVGMGLARVHQMDLGFDTKNMLLMDVPLPLAGYQQISSVRLLTERLLERLNGIGTVQSAAVSTSLSMARLTDASGTGEAATVQSSNARINSESYTSVTPAYFAAAGMRLVEGRPFAEGDRLGSENVVIINEEAARQLFGTRSSLGEHLRFGHTSEDRRTRTVVGVVRNVTMQPLDPEVEPRLYVPFSQDPGRQLTLTVRTSRQPEPVAASVSQIVRMIDPTLAIESPVTAEQRLASALWPLWFFNGFAALSSVFGLVIAGAGVYGLTRYLVIARTREIGLRLALGAGAPTIAAMILRQNAIPIVGGIGVGLAASLALSKLLEGMLLGIRPYDPVAFAIAGGVLLLAAGAAVGLPAIRAGHISPVDALRTE